MTCDCLPDANGNPTCQGLAAQPAIVDTPISRMMKGRLREQGWAPITETLVRERERIQWAATALSWTTQTCGGDEYVIDIGTLEHILETE